MKTYAVTLTAEDWEFVLAALQDTNPVLYAAVLDQLMRQR